MDLFVMGAMAMASFVVGLFFLRYYCNTHDRIFLIFAMAFWLLGITRILLAVAITSNGVKGDEHQYIYLIRLTAFVLILGAIIDKNWPRESDTSHR